MITIIQAVILGVVEGATEFLPISSTAHLILVSDILKISQSEYVKSFEIIIQLGAILAIVSLYWRRFLDPTILKKLFTAFLPTGILGLLFYKFVKAHLIGNITVVLWSLALGGALLIVLERFVFEKPHDGNPPMEVDSIGYLQCLALGIFQSIAMVPGVSRAAATIVGGLLMRIPRKTIVEFSFLLAVPTMAAAAGLDIIKSSASWSADQTAVLAVGFVVSFGTAVMAVKWLLQYISRHSFFAFGVYRLALVALFLV